MDEYTTLLGPARINIIPALPVAYAASHGGKTGPNPINSGKESAIVGRLARPKDEIEVYWFSEQPNGYITDELITLLGRKSGVLSEQV